MSDKDGILQSLKTIVVPGLRANGFTGTFPHFRRPGEEVYDLVTFQFNKRGGSFAVEIARCYSSGIDGLQGHVDAAKAKAWDRHPNYRSRIGPKKGDNWFSYATGKTDEIAKIVLTILLDTATWADVSPSGSETPYKKSS